MPNVEQANDGEASNDPWAAHILALSGRSDLSDLSHPKNDGLNGFSRLTVGGTGPKHPALPGDDECALGAAEITSKSFTSRFDYHLPSRPDIYVKRQRRQQQEPDIFSDVKVCLNKNHRREAVVYI
jgi:hypothetical protein